MIESIKGQRAGMSYQNTNKNKKEALSEMNFTNLLSQAVERAEKNNDADPVHSKSESGMTRDDRMRIIQNKIHELQRRIVNGENEPTYQIGNTTLTEKEWDDFIIQVDALLDKDEPKEETKEETKEESTKEIDKDI